ncbi:hypothetical protein EJ05DRAFT_145296 [Pseudovirgaria hyperparasitica]|uniref:Cation-transporting P-type ATPase N-terminal domain-containing protein n=1 Tax=Pseudovirgaria hyperparasitica TaxID=470096 RepID=A0A6A6VWN0_9PEZI|nr:uncharacterized protein EJ05DRAFT_145296 [Pseudovirgaria hyperparasitica]KAF2754575.1 hypothetical protein EJ05DRAFT_145296 [Pseudovirgaria hyperparasitica]
MFGKDKEKDIEKSGNPNGGNTTEKKADNPYEGLDEYVALQRYISTYRDPRAAKFEEAALEEERKKANAGKKWWQSKKADDGTGSDTTGIVPDEWLEADIKYGITDHDVAERRKRFGWNEIVTEKTNKFLQFISYFQGPVLYVS